MTFPAKYLILIRSLSPPTLAGETHHLVKGEGKNMKRSPGPNGVSAKLKVRRTACIPRMGPRV